MTTLKLTRPITFIDIETTGLDAREGHRIVEICLIKINPDGTEETLSSLINPAMQIPFDATKIHGITNEDVKGKPTFNELAPKIIDFIDNCDLGGFNTKFDLGFLEAEFRSAGIKYSEEERTVLDVQRIFHTLEPRDLSAAHLKYLGKPLEGAHRSDKDVRATIEVLEAQLKQHAHLSREVVGLHEFYNPRDPAWIDKEGKFIWFEGKAHLNFGNKFKGKSLEFVSKIDPSYLQWMLIANFSTKVKEIVQNALDGKFPELTK